MAGDGHRKALSLPACREVAWCQAEVDGLPLPCAGAGNQCWGWWAGEGISACRICKRFLYIYINATVLLWSIKDPLEIREWCSLWTAWEARQPGTRRGPSPASPGRASPRGASGAVQPCGAAGQKLGEPGARGPGGPEAEATPPRGIGSAEPRDGDASASARVRMQGPKMAARPRGQTRVCHFRAGEKGGTLANKAAGRAFTLTGAQAVQWWLRAKGPTDGRHAELPSAARRAEAARPMRWLGRGRALYKLSIGGHSALVPKDHVCEPGFPVRKHLQEAGAPRAAAPRRGHRSAPAHQGGGETRVGRTRRGPGEDGGRGRRAGPPCAEGRARARPGVGRGRRRWPPGPGRSPRGLAGPRGSGGLGSRRAGRAEAGRSRCWFS